MIKDYQLKSYFYDVLIQMYQTIHWLKSNTSYKKFGTGISVEWMGSVDILVRNKFFKAGSKYCKTLSHFQRFSGHWSILEWNDFRRLRWMCLNQRNAYVFTKLLSRNFRKFNNYNCKEHSVMIDSN